jgi:hypothetical protein
MNLVLNNPFRILGLPVSASEKAIAKRISDLMIFAEMGKPVSYETDFPFLSDIQRTPESVREAANQIEQPENRLFYAMFWFWKHNQTDEQCFDLLKNADVGNAAGLWENCILNKDISDNNYSNLRNFAVLCLGLAAVTQIPLSVRETLFLKGINLTGKTCYYHRADEYFRRIAGENYSPDKEKISRYFADEAVQFVQKEFPDKTDAQILQEMLGALGIFSAEIASYLAGKFISQPIQRIEAAIENSRNRRTGVPAHADRYGEILYQTVIKDLKYLRELFQNQPSEIVGLHYGMLADRLANEVLQCGIDYFNTRIKHQNGTAPGKKALSLIKYAESLAVGQKVRQRIQKNVPIIASWINAAPQRETQREIQLLADDIAAQLNRVPDMLSHSEPLQYPDIFQELFDGCTDKLLIIKEFMGANHEVYLRLSSAAANSGLELCTAYASATGEHRQAAAIMKRAGALDMLPEIREKYNEQYEILNQAAENEIFQQISQPSEKKRCYIASMVFGEDAPQVLVLRKFRDNVLRRYLLGRIFIRLYERYSPLFVARFKNSELANRMAAMVLNALIQLKIQG